MLRYLFRFSFAFAVVIGLLALIAFFLPRHQVVERTVTIAAPPAAVFPLVGDLARWKDWAISYERDPTMVSQYSPVTAGTGAWTTWESKQEGVGRVEFLEVVAPETVRYRKTYTNMTLSWEGSIKLVATGGGAQTVVTWRDDVNLGWSPVNRWFGLMLDRLLGSDVGKCVAKLKTVAEQKR